MASQSSNGDFEGINALLSNFFDHLEKRIDEEKYHVGVSTGFADLDDKTSGLKSALQNSSMVHYQQ